MIQLQFSSGRALLIGVGADLPSTIEDATGLASILKDPSRSAYPPEQVALLTGLAADRPGIMAALDRLREASDEETTAVIYFSGHGFRVTGPSGEAYYLMPHGYDENRLSQTAISGAEFVERLKAIPARKLLLLLDCCHAGGLADLLAPGLQFAKAPLPPESLTLLAEGRGRVVIASSTEDEYSFAGRPYSAFTLALIEALCGVGSSKKDGYVRVADLALHTREKVPQRTKGRQHPILHFERADNFILAYYAAGDPQPKALPFSKEPEIEPEPGAFYSTFDQRGQTVHGPQTNIGSSVGPVLSGEFKGSFHVGDKIIHQAPQLPSISLHTPPRQIPLPPQDFTGRNDEQDKLRAHFDRGATIIGLRGLGGVGKTALAYVVAYRLRDRFPDGQIMVDLQGTGESPLTPADAMGHVIHAFHPIARLPDSDGELAGLYRSVLDGKRALLLLDNALDDRQVRPLLPPASFGVLITSRRRFTLSGLQPLDLDVLNPDEAVALLSKVLQPSAAAPVPEDGPLADIARLCGYLPLALRAAGSMLANTPDLSPAEYAEELEAERSRLERLGEEGVDLGVEASINLSYRRLKPQTAAVFRLLSIFPADFDAAAEEAVCQEGGHRELRELLRWSLVDYTEGRYRLHDLARIFAAARLEEDGDAGAAAGRRHAEHYREVLSATNEMYLQGGEKMLDALKLFDSEWANIAAGQAWAERLASKDPTAAALSSAYPDAGAYMLSLRLHPRELIHWLNTGLAGARQLKNRVTEGAHLGNIGNVYVNLGDPQRALDNYEQALDIAREIGDRLEEGAVLGNVGLAYADLSEPLKALEFYKQALAIHREVGDRRGEGSALSNMGLAYADLGEPLKALEFYEQSLAIHREIGDKKGEGNALNSKGNAYAAMGKPRQALQLFKQALTIAREIGDKRGEGIALGNIANTYYALGDLRRALDLNEQHLAITREIGDRRGEGADLGNMGLVYVALGDPHRALEFYEQSLAIAREIGNRRGEGIALGNLGNAYAALGEPRRAIECAEAALAIFEAIESPYAERARQQLAELRSKGDDP
ncbi:MAG: tetratricopeptide repeat protein [Methanotrichaceae archaeon]|nr:tetratricopeptide repeat protein [Methanotrichaceae archaeon]